MSPLRQYLCLLEAQRAGRTARAALVSTTVEGDPIVTYLFVNGRLPVLVVVDATRDDFGPRVWTQRRCRGMRLRDATLAFDRCETIRRGKPRWLKPIPLRR